MEGLLHIQGLYRSPNQDLAFGRIAVSRGFIKQEDLDDCLEEQKRLLQTGRQTPFLGNLLRECGVTDRLQDTAQNAMMNIVTIFLSISVGATTVASNFLRLQTIVIIILGLAAFAFSTVGGVLLGKLMYKISGGKINPLIGSAGVSAVPMAARVSQVEGRKANPFNYLLMHAMGPNVAGVIGSAVAAGFLLALFG